MLPIVQNMEHLHFTANELNEKFDNMIEHLLDYYKDGKYSFDAFKEDNPNEAIPNTHRQAKTKLKKNISERINNDKDEVIQCLMDYFYHNDESQYKRFIKEKRELKNKIKELRDEINLLENYQVTEQNRMENEYKKQMIEEAVNTDLGLKCERLLARNKMISEKMEFQNKEIQMMRLKHKEEKDELQDQMTQMIASRAPVTEGKSKSNSNKDSKYKNKYLRAKDENEKLKKELNELKGDESETSDDE